LSGNIDFPAAGFEVSSVQRPLLASKIISGLNRDNISMKPLSWLRRLVKREILS